jgi:hypothetical protein
MTDFNQNVSSAKDVLNLEEGDMQKLPQMLNVLTILTYIGCALGAIGAIYGYFSAETSYKIYQKLQTEPGVVDSSNPAKAMIAGATDIVKKSYDNRLMILLFAIAGIALCFYGAVQMRNFKKQGFLIYAVGEILPIISFALFIGFGNLLGGITGVFTVLIAAVFIIMYSTQRKFLVK